MAKNITVPQNIDAVFAANNLPMTRDEIKYTVSFDTNGIVTLEDVQDH